MALEYLDFTFCPAEVFPTLLELSLYSDLVNLEICIFPQRSLVESRSRLSQRLFEKMYLQFEAKVLLLNFVDDLERTSAFIDVKFEFALTFSCSRRVIMFP